MAPLPPRAFLGIKWKKGTKRPDKQQRRSICQAAQVPGRRPGARGLLQGSFEEVPALLYGRGEGGGAARASFTDSCRVQLMPL